MAAKIMLVEDDTNLSDIYRARLEAEGFEIVSAADGEEALALAVREKPDLIISDVMMPKISGFDMLDILRSTDGIKDTKVIMMTALSQAEDQARATKLGANKYLVKSQVTLEDVVKTVHEVLGDEEAEEPAIAPAERTAESENAEKAPSDSETATAAAENEPVSPEPIEPTPSKGEGPAVTTPPITSIPVIQAPNDGADDKTTPASSPTPDDNNTPAPTPEPVNDPSSQTPTPDLDSDTNSATTEPSGSNAVESEPEDITTETAAAPSPDSQKSNEQTLPAVTENSELTGDQSVTDEQSTVLSQIQDFVDKQEVSSAVPPLEAAKPDDQTVPTTDNIIRPNISSVSVSSDSKPNPSRVINSSGDSSPVANKKVIEPITDINPRPSINELLAKEEAKQAGESSPESKDSLTPAASSTVPVPSSSSQQVDPNAISL